MNIKPSACFSLSRCLVLLIILSIVLIIFTGCNWHRQEMYRDIQQQREQAYFQWQREREEMGRRQLMLDGTLSLEEALQTALRHNKSLAATLREKEIAEGMVWESYSNILPQLTGEADYVRLGDQPSTGIEDMLGIDMPQMPQNHYTLGLRVTQPLYRGGAIPAAIRTARLAYLLADEKVRDAVQEVSYSVKKSYYDILLARQLLEVQQDAVESAQAHLESVLSKQRQGLATEFDVLRAQVDVALFEAERISQQNKIHLAMAELLRIMGVSQESEVELADDLQYVPFEKSYEEMIHVAFKNRPDLYQAELGIRIQEESLKMARSRYLPSLNAWYNHEWGRPDPLRSQRDEWDDTWRAGISLSMTFFDGFRREGQIRQEKSKLQQQQFTMMHTEEAVLQQVRRGLLSIQDAEELIQSQSLNVKRANEALRLAEAGYREGITDAVEVTEARAALTRAQALYYESVYNHITAVLSVKKATGQLGPQRGVTSGDSWQETAGESDSVLFIQNSRKENNSDQKFDRKGDR